MSTFHTGDHGRFPMVEDACAHLQDELSHLQERLYGRRIFLPSQQEQQDTPAFAPDASECPGRYAIAVLERRDMLEEQVALAQCRLLANHRIALVGPGAAAEVKASIIGSHPVARYKRLYRKFRENPYKYLADSKHPLLRSCRYLFKSKK